MNEPKIESLSLDQEHDGTSTYMNRALRLIGGIASVTGFLFAFGYLSERALFNFAGLPMLSLDYGATVETGANALIESLGLIVNDVGRGLFVGSVILLWIGVLIWHDRITWLSRLLKSPTACAVFQAAMCIIVSLQLVGLLAITKLADQHEQDELSRDVRAQIEDLRRSEAWTPRREGELIARASYPTAGLFLPIGIAFTRWEHDDDAENSVLAPGFPLRRFRADRANARTLYSWAFILSVTLVSLSFVARWWRRRLQAVERNSASAVGPNLSRWSDKFRLVQVPVQRLWLICAYVIEPLILALGLVSFILLPTAYGILINSFIGEERVIVRLKDRCIERIDPPALLTSEEPAQRDDPDPLRALRAAAGLPEEPHAVKRTSRSAEPQKPIRLHECDGKSDERADGLASDALQAMLEVLIERDHGSESIESVDKFKRKIDVLVAWTMQTGCRAGLDALRRLRPVSGLYAATPEVSEYIVRQWLEMQSRYDVTRSGYILRYPRGDDRDSIMLFDSLVERSAANSGRWLIETIPRDCIGEILVAPDPLAEAITRMADANMDLKGGAGADKSYGALKNVLFAVDPRFVESAIGRVERGASGLSTELDVQITLIGSHLAALGDAEPTLTMRSTTVLIDILKDSSRNQGTRAVAAAALELIGGPWAASQVAPELAALISAPTEVVAHIVKASGRLAGDYRGWLTQYSEPDVAREKLRPFEEFLTHIASDMSISSTTRGRAVVALGQGGFADSVPVITAAEAMCPPSSRNFLALCAIGALATLGAEDGRTFMRRLALNAENLYAADVRGEALKGLYRLGVSQEHELFLGLVRSANTDVKVAGQAIEYLEDLDPRAALEELLGCLESNEVPLGERLICARSLPLLAKSYDLGDWTVEKLVSSMRGLKELASRNFDSKDSDLLDELQTAVCVGLVKLQLDASNAAEEALNGMARCEREVEIIPGIAYDHEDESLYFDKTASDSHSRRHFFFDKLKDALEDRSKRRPKLPVLPSLDGSSVDLARVSKNGLLFLDFWASWCGPCAMTRPHVETVMAEFAARGVAFYAVNQREDKATVTAYTASQNITIPVLLDEEGEFGEALQVEGLPTLVLIDSSGAVVWRWDGMADADMLRDKITAALAPPLAAPLQQGLSRSP
jgi:cytochrome c biogenesis protein CcmG/thiol:disulfide interchange protein DsbE